MKNDGVKRSLEEIFISTFHEKMSFAEFLKLDVKSEFHKIVKSKRTIYAPSPKLKQIHRFINKTILEFADYNLDVVYSYRKGVSIRDAVEKHAKNDFFFQTDLSNFYGNIHSDNVKSCLSKQLSNVLISDIDCYVGRIEELTVIDNHIPAGFSTSPLLSNICLFDFDNALLKNCEENNLTYTRYSDDIIISGSDVDFAHDIENTINNHLATYVNNDIKLNKLKTKFNKKGHDFKILGFNILPNGIVTIPSTDKKEVESLLYFYLTNRDKFENYFQVLANNKNLDLNEKSLQEYATGTLSGKLIAFNAMDKSYISKLRRKYGNTVIDMFIRKSVK
ncbi:reverse transcriptase family protein [Rheinheimera texasensis]|uniref:reverse transcriptase family protein n=1 Tax=Rheinheimera texasensis TaxID=306205 RepID=UPI0032B24C43